MKTLNILIDLPRRIYLLHFIPGGCPDVIAFLTYLVSQACCDPWFQVQLEENHSARHPRRRSPESMQDHHRAGSAIGAEVAGKSTLRCFSRLPATMRIRVDRRDEFEGQYEEQTANLPGDGVGS